ncbi:MAG: CoA transferase [Pseudomonadales bacterium]|nr:CoA transferase [Pseudomonadales bacterium]
MAGALDGLRVIELSIAVQGPAAGVYLADMGAEVIKVEPPLGDPSRYGRGVDNATPVGTPGPQFVACNRGKRSVCMDLATPEGNRAMHALLSAGDVFLSNYRAPALKKLGLDYDTLAARYPRLVHATVNGFGPLGPDAERAMLDGAAVARGGLAGMTGYDDRPPVLPAATVGDHAGAMQLAMGIVTALFARERNGRGQQVCTSALGAQLWLQQWELTHVSMTGARLPPAGSHHPNIRGPYGIYRTADGGAIMIAQTMAAPAWDAFCVFADLPELAFDARWNTPGGRLGEGNTAEDSAYVRECLTTAFARHTTAAWEAFLRSQPEIIFERVRRWEDVFDDPQNHANGYLAEVPVAGVGNVRLVGNLVHLSATPGRVAGGPPDLGEGNQAVLSAAGLSAVEIDALTSHATSRREAILAALLPGSD